MSKVTLYTTPYCPFCVRAKQLLDNRKVSYDDHDVSNDPALRQKVSAQHGNFPTVPMILIGETFVGGYSELQELVQSGQFDQMLEKV